MAISEATYERVALEDPDGLWELVCGRLRQKRGMTSQHDYVIQELDYQPSLQVDPGLYSVRTDPFRLRAPSGSHHIPDLCVVPRAALRQALEQRRNCVEAYTQPTLFVVEVWSPSTGARDRSIKLGDYRDRGDQEIWLIHPRRRVITAWRRQADGSYTESLYTDGKVPIESLPGVSVDMAALFGIE